MKYNKNIIVITGGAGFVGSNLIQYLLKKTKFKIISLDNYSSGTKKNHIKNLRVKYINSNTKNISKILKSYKNKINEIINMNNLAMHTLENALLDVKKQSIQKLDCFEAYKK